jgi:hypothetical protein
MRWNLVLSFVLLASAACEKQPAQIRIKLPQSSYASVRADPVLPPFEKKGDTIALRASGFDKDGAFMGAAPVKWSSSDPSVASVSLDGIVSIISSGKTTIKATTSTYKQQLEAEFPISAVIIDKVEIIPPALDEDGAIHMGDIVKFAAKVFDDRGNVIPDAKVKWRTSDFAATIMPDGELEGRSIGDTQVIAEAGPKNARFTINVKDWKPEKKRR